MDDIKYIKRLYEKEELSIRKVMRRTGHHYISIRTKIHKEFFYIQTKRIFPETFCIGQHILFISNITKLNI